MRIQLNRTIATTAKSWRFILKSFFRQYLQSATVFEILALVGNSIKFQQPTIFYR